MEYTMSSPLNNEAPHVPNWLGSQPIQIKFPNEKELSEKVSVFHGRIIKNLIEHKGQNNVIRALLYVIIDAFLEKFWLSRECPEKKKNSDFKSKYENSPYLHYVQYKAFLAKAKMVELTEEKKVRADAKLYNLNVDLEKIEERSKRDTFVKIVSTRILQNSDKLLQEELNGIDHNDKGSQEKFKELLDHYNCDEKLKKAFYEEATVEAIPKVQKVLQKSIDGYQEELNRAEAKVKESQRWISTKGQLKKILQHQIERIKEAAEQLRRKDLTNEQVEKFSVGILHRNPQMANLQMRQIAANFPFKDLNAELAQTAEVALYPSENTLERQGLVFEKFFKEAISDDTTPEQPQKVVIVAEQPIPQLDKKEEKKSELPVIEKSSMKEVIESQPSVAKAEPKVVTPVSKKEKKGNKKDAVGLVDRLKAKAANILSPPKNDKDTRSPKAQTEIKKLKKLLPNIVRDKFDDLSQPVFYILLCHLTVPLETYENIINKFELEELNQEMKQLSISFEHLVQKTSPLKNEKNEQEINSTKEFIIFKINAVQALIVKKNSSQK